MVLIAISSAVAIILLTVLLYVLIGRSDHHSLATTFRLSHVSHVQGLFILSVGET